MMDIESKLEEISGYNDHTMISKSDLFKAIDEFTKRWNGKIVDPIEIRSLIRKLPASQQLAKPAVEKRLVDALHRADLALKGYRTHLDDHQPCDAEKNIKIVLAAYDALEEK
jgi:hypothetical protein